MKLLKSMCVIVLSVFSTSNGMQQHYSHMTVNGKNYYFPIDGDFSNVSMTALGLSVFADGSYAYGPMVSQNGRQIQPISEEEYKRRQANAQKTDDFEKRGQIDQEDNVVREDYSDIIAEEKINSIVFDGTGEVIVQQGDENKIIIETQKRELDSVKVIYKNGILSLDADAPTKIYVTLSGLKGVVINGNGHVTVSEKFKKGLKTKIIGEGQVTFIYTFIQ